MANLHRGEIEAEIGGVNRTLVLTAYFGGRSLEKVARILGRK